MPVGSYAHGARPSTLTLGASMRCGALPVPERFDTASACRTLASLSTTAMKILQHGGVNLAGRPASSMAWSRALRAADSASFISPLSFDGDKRCRIRQFYEAVASDRSSFFQLRLSECWRSHNSGDTIHIFDVKLFCASLNYVQNQMSEYVSLMRESCRS